ncbi:MAG: sulfite exporter TauE/SafE family protein [Hyphomicrobiales bacterium]|nr:sulfite exporter TauE/SafE family protein [Hyphomicrobiales bacterium]
MDAFHVAFLLFAGIAGGAISTLAGGAAIITFPALLATGLSPVLASCTNLVALVPGNLFSGFYDRRSLPPLGRSFAFMVAASIAGSLTGATLLMLTPVRVFSALIPLLLGFATVLFAFAGRISAWLRARAATRGAGPHHWSGIVAWLLPVSVYGGYFGAGVGVLALGVISVGTAGDYRSANVAKNLVVGINSAVVAVFFTVSGMVAWPQALLMMAGVPLGAWLGSHAARAISNEAARWLLVAIGAMLTVAFAWRYWF